MPCKLLKQNHLIDNKTSLMSCVFLKCPCHLLRNNIQENIEIIRLQREVKDKGTRFTALQSQYSNMEEVRCSTLSDQCVKIS